VSRKTTDVAHYNFTADLMILVIFDREVAERGPVAPTPLKFKCHLNIDLSGT